MTEYNLDDPVYYFAYGSNMNPERMLERQADFTLRQGHKLPGYSLRFNKASSKNPGTGCANIVPDEKGVVEGIIYKTTVRGLYNLDIFEGYPEHYGRIRLILDIGASKETVKIYTAMPDKVSEGLRPTKSYLGHLLKAGDDLSPEYYDFLLNIKTSG